ncbi:hypothetical protein ACMD2_19509 [Ananas comosus]|uniref:Uncharacterized protein n=1 Tax=Ananas comosus TaxID=4615 RepID=A0A199UWC8_ANACO|nr:hypothetical protein ACMD2_19509 [Ananas comosus]
MDEAEMHPISSCYHSSNFIVPITPPSHLHPSPALAAPPRRRRLSPGRRRAITIFFPLFLSPSLLSVVRRPETVATFGPSLGVAPCSGDHPRRPPLSPAPPQPLQPPAAAQASSGRGGLLPLPARRHRLETLPPTSSVPGAPSPVAAAPRAAVAASASRGRPRPARSEASPRLLPRTAAARGHTPSTPPASCNLPPPSRSSPAAAVAVASLEPEPELVRAELVSPKPLPLPVANRGEHGVPHLPLTRLRAPLAPSCRRRPAGARLLRQSPK